MIMATMQKKWCHTKSAVEMDCLKIYIECVQMAFAFLLRPYNGVLNLRISKTFRVGALLPIRWIRWTNSCFFRFSILSQIIIIKNATVENPKQQFLLKKKISNDEIHNELAFVSRRDSFIFFSKLNKQCWIHTQTIATCWECHMCWSNRSIRSESVW